MTTVLWAVLWVALLILVVVAWASRAAADVRRHFRADCGRTACSGPQRTWVEVIRDRRLVWAWVLALALVSVPIFNASGHPVSAGGVVAFSAGIGLLAGFVMAAVSYTRLPTSVRRGRTGRKAVIGWVFGLVGAGLLLWLVALVLDRWIVLAG